VVDPSENKKTLSILVQVLINIIKEKQLLFKRSEQITGCFRDSWISINAQGRILEVAKQEKTAIYKTYILIFSKKIQTYAKQ